MLQGRERPAAVTLGGSLYVCGGLEKAGGWTPPSGWWIFLGGWWLYLYCTILTCLLHIRFIIILELGILSLIN